MKRSLLSGLSGFIVCMCLLSSAHAQQVPAAQEGYVDLSGVRIWYKDTGGAGEPVVFLHASTGSVRVWERYQVEAFTNAGYRMIMYDRRGWGRTIVDPSGPQPGNAADDLAGLLDYLAVQRFHIVATASGGSVAWDIALSMPERVRSMVIANNTGRIDDSAYREIVTSLRPAQWDELPAEFRELSPAYRVEDPEGARRWAELEHMSRPAGVTASQPLNNRLTFDLLATVQTPVLLIAGGADLLAPAPLQRFFTDSVRNIETLVVPDAGHSVYWERPVVFNRAVLEFIGRH